MMWASSRVRSVVRIVGACLIAVSLSGCIGAVDRNDFDRLMRVRGGGMTSSLVSDGFGRLADRYGVDQVSVTAIDDLDATSFTLDQVPALRNVEKLVDDALAGSDLEDGEVTGISVSRTATIHASVMVESPRSRVLVVVEPDGTLSLVQPL